MNLTTRPLIVTRLRRTLLAAACSVLAVATCASALALHVEAPAPAPLLTVADQKHVSGDIMAGQILTRIMPVYPPDAKANHDTLDGPVILHVIIDTDGIPQNIVVQQSLRRDYDSSALEAVRQWRWKPYLLNGVATEVDTTVTITYNTDHPHDKPSK